MTTEFERQLELLRARDQVSLMTEEKEGFSLFDLNGGVYGFTASPFGDSAPLFRGRIYQSFECHKLPDGTMHIIGFVTAEQGEQVEAGREAGELDLYPEPHEKATRAVSLSLDRIAHQKPPSREQGNYIRLRVNAIQ